MPYLDDNIGVEVFCDFDGTITQGDATDAVLNQFAEPQWREWEALWQAGEISGRECLKEQVALIRAERQDILDFVAQLPIDRGILKLAEGCDRLAIPLTIVSDGLDVILGGVLRHHGLSRLPYFANRVIWERQDRISLDFPYAEPRCGSGTCKCRLTRPIARRAYSAYIGDGRSDFCVVQQVDLVYAKGALRGWCQRQHIPFYPFEGLDEVATHLCPEGALIR